MFKYKPIIYYLKKFNRKYRFLISKNSLNYNYISQWLFIALINKYLEYWQ